MIEDIVLDCLEVAGQMERCAFISEVSKEFDLDNEETEKTLVSLIKAGKVHAFVNKKKHIILELRN